MLAAPIAVVEDPFALLFKRLREEYLSVCITTLPTPSGDSRLAGV